MTARSDKSWLLEEPLSLIAGEFNHHLNALVMEPEFFLKASLIGDDAASVEQVTVEISLLEAVPLDLIPDLL